MNAAVLDLPPIGLVDAGGPIEPDFRWRELRETGRVYSAIARSGVWYVVGFRAEFDRARDFPTFMEHLVREVPAIALMDPHGAGRDFCLRLALDLDAAFEEWKAVAKRAAG